MQATALRNAFADVLSRIAGWWNRQGRPAGPGHDDFKLTDSMERELCARESGW